MAKILITGGAGFIASHLTDKLIEKGHKVAVIDNLSTGRKENLNPKAKFYKADICDSEISEIFKKEKPEIVFHFAAQIDVRKSVKNPIQDAKVNILGTLNILEDCRKFRVKKFIFASSGGVMYGDAKIIPTPESYPENPESPYGIAKLTIEKYLQFYKNSYNLDYVVLRYSNIYGPRQNSKSEAGVVAIFTDELLNNETPIIFGDGKQTRDYLYVADAVEAALKSLNSAREQVSGSSSSVYNTGSVYNIGTGIETNVNNIYKLLTEETKRNIESRYAPFKKGELSRSCLDCSKIKKELGWKPEYNLEEGLRETVKWYKNYILVKK